MFNDSADIQLASANENALVTPQDWRPIYQVSDQVVLYNPTSHAIAIRGTPAAPVHEDNHRESCPYCRQPLPDGFVAGYDGEDPFNTTRAANYFHLLSIANDTWSRPSTPPLQEDGHDTQFSAEGLADGYFKAFFKEEQKLGMGANGSVYLCQHILDGNELGHFAVKKVAVGQSHSYLINILREVRLLERMHHPNIVTYHHSWLETAQFSPFGPKVPTLHILMQWAEGGSLDDFIDVRLGRESHAYLSPSAGNEAGPDLMTRSARIRAHKMFQRASPEEKERLRRQMNADRTRSGQTWTPVHLLSAEEVKSLFGDVVEGLAFLHAKSVLHLDLKPGNVLLTWDEGRLIPRAMLSDFGTSRDMLNAGQRSGNTGTLEYVAPESLPSPRDGLLRQIDSKADMWSLGMILHKLLFFKLPYRYSSSDTSQSVNGLAESDKMAKLEEEVLNYQGYSYNQTTSAAFESRSIPQTYLFLLRNLLSPQPSTRPTCDKVLSALREGKLNPIIRSRSRSPIGASGTLMPLVRRPSGDDVAGGAMLEDSPGISTMLEEVPIEQLVHTDSRSPTPAPAASEKPPPFLVLPPPPLAGGSPSLNVARSSHALKSGVLVLKIVNLGTMRHASTPAMLGLAMLAVADTWVNDWRLSTGLVLAHLVLVKGLALL